MADLTNNQQISWPKHIPVPSSFICPITQSIMTQPVIDREGNSYQKEAIIKHLQQATKRVSPITGNRLRISDLVDNKALKEAIDSALQMAIASSSNDNNTKSSNTKTRSNRKIKSIMSRFMMRKSSSNASSSSSSTLPTRNVSESSSAPHSINSNTKCNKDDDIEKKQMKQALDDSARGLEELKSTLVSVQSQLDEIKKTQLDAVTKQQDSSNKEKKKQDESSGGIDTSEKSNDSISTDLAFGEAQLEKEREIEKKWEEIRIERQQIRSRSSNNLGNSTATEVVDNTANRFRSSTATAIVDNTSHRDEEVPKQINTDTASSDEVDFNSSKESLTLSKDSSLSSNNSSLEESSDSPQTSDSQSSSTKEQVRHVPPKRQLLKKGVSINRSMLSLMSTTETIPEDKPHVPPREIERWASMKTLGSTMTDEDFDESTATEAFYQHDNVNYAELSMTSLATEEESETQVEQEDFDESTASEAFGKHNNLNFVQLSTTSLETEAEESTVVTEADRPYYRRATVGSSTVSEITAEVSSSSLAPENERLSAQPRRRRTVDTVESSCTLAMHQHNEINFTVLAAPVIAEDENSTIGELQRLQRDSAGKAKLRLSTGEHTFLSDESLASVSDSASENTKLLKEQSINEDRRRRLSTDVEQSIKVPSGITITERMRQLSDLTVSRDMQSSFNSSANSSSIFNSFNSSSVLTSDKESK